MDSITRIVNGSPVSIEDYPHQVALLYKDYFICGGSIISKIFVLTAAHCTYGFVTLKLIF